jgi:hypothetical protein
MKSDPVNGEYQIAVPVISSQVDIILGAVMNDHLNEKKLTPTVC